MVSENRRLFIDIRRFFENSIKKVEKNCRKRDILFGRFMRK